jgi:hypothetical protein
LAFGNAGLAATDVVDKDLMNPTAAFARDWRAMSGYAEGETMSLVNLFRSTLVRRVGAVTGAAAVTAGAVLALAAPSDAASASATNSIQVCASGGGSDTLDVPPSGYLAGFASTEITPGSCYNVWLEADGPREVDVYKNGALAWQTWWDGTYPLYVTV